VDRALATIATVTESYPMPKVTSDLPEAVLKAKDFWTETVNTLTESTQQARESLMQTAHQAVKNVTEATDKTLDTATATAEQIRNSLTTTTHTAVDTATATAQQAKVSFGETIEQTKGSLEQTLQTAGQLKSTIPEAMQTAISSTTSDWLQAHPVAFRLVQLLLWAANHPILSLVILLFAVAIAWSFIKALTRLIDTLGWSLLQAPFKLSLVLMGVGFKSLGKIEGLAGNQLAIAKNTDMPALENSSSDQIQPDKQQRLAEISTRLEAIRQEQSELLQEAAAILLLDS